MVRKRSKGARRHYESEDEPETESDFEDDPEYDPAPKKYSLRQRKKTTFNSDDWEYEEDAPVPASKAEEAPEEEVEEAEVEVQKKPNNTETDETAKSEQVSSNPEPTAETAKEAVAENADDELVDFEDMIRADIVVNKNRIDYDNVIQKTEIKIQPLPANEKKDPPKRKVMKQSLSNKPKGKRGRKPKRKNNEIEEPQYFAPQIQEDENDEDYHPYLKPKRTRKPKKRPAGEIDSSLLEGFEHDDDYDDQNDMDYNPEDDLDYPGLSNYILNKQISDDFDDSLPNILLSQPETTAQVTEEPTPSIEAATADVTDSNSKTDPVSIPKDTEAYTVTTESNSTINSETAFVNEATTTSATPVEADTTSITSVPDTTDAVVPPEPPEEIASTTETNTVEENKLAPIQLEEINESETSNSLEKVSSTSQESFIKVNENCVTSDVHVNGSVKHIEAPEINPVNTDEEEDDDDIVFVEEEKKYEIIVLDD